MALSRFRGELARIYSFDILGAGAGSLGVVALLFVLSPAEALKLVGALGCAAAAVAWLECGGRRRWPALLAMLLAGLLLAAAARPGSAPAMSPYKELSQTLRIPEARVVDAALEPAGPGQRGREPAHSAAPRAGPEPQRADASRRRSWASSSTAKASTR